MIDKKETTCLHPEIENKIHKWIKHRNESAVLLLGNPGVGKTTLAHRIFKDDSLKTIEFNASHTRSGASFRKTTSSETEPPRSSARLAGEDTVTVITLEPYFWCLRCAYFQNPGRRIKAPLKRFLSGVQKTT